LASTSATYQSAWLYANSAAVDLQRRADPVTGWMTREEVRRFEDLDPEPGRYDCVAYTSKFEAPPVEGQNRTGLFGYPCWLVFDYADSKLVWCKVSRGTGEGGSSLASVPVPEPCRDPAGPG
jgi:hypothetical protein